MKCLNYKRSHSDFYQDSSHIIANICKTKHSTGLVNFAHDITFANNKITMLTKDIGLIDTYEKNRIPTLCTDNSGRTLQNGIYINKTLENQDKGCSILMPLLHNIAKRHRYHYGQNSLHLVKREDNYQHLYSLFFDLSEDIFLHWVINNGQFLHDFIAEYTLKMQDLLVAATFEENKLELPSFQQTFSIKQTKNSKTVTIVHKPLNTPIHLTIQQGKCLFFILNGMTAEQIAINMDLSHRTIESYTENIRQILHCSTSKQLITFYNDQCSLLEEQILSK